MIDIVVGGQYGSEGKGKVAYCLAEASEHKCIIRTGGCNSGHTVNGEILRCLPSSVLLKGSKSVLGAGSYIDLDVLFNEIDRFKPEFLYIDEKATIITGKERDTLRTSIGSTLSGTGYAVKERVERTKAVLARDIKRLSPYLCTTEQIHELISNGAVIEGTQGFGLSLLHTPYFPFCTSRDTTSSSLASEVGISPKDVGNIYLVIRSFPIRVAGNSGPLPYETTWEEIGIDREITSVTKKVRRVAYFDPEIVKLAIKVNKPDFIVLNHLDYIKENKQKSFVRDVEKKLGREIDYLGLNKLDIITKRLFNSFFI